MPKGRGLAVVAAAALLVGVSGCELKDDGSNLVAGKENFVAKCGSCHVLKRAGTTGVTGPNLDEAFQRARQDGFGPSTFEGIVTARSSIPAGTRQTDPATGKLTAKMPAKIFTGEDATGRRRLRRQRGLQERRGQGPAGAAGVKRSTKVAKEEGGKLAIPADPGGALAYQFGSAQSQPGSVEIDSENESGSTTTSRSRAAGSTRRARSSRTAASQRSPPTSSRRVHVLCSVPGHREGGMEGKLTVKYRRAARGVARLVGVVPLARAREEEREREHDQHDVERDDHPPANPLVVDG